MQRNINASDCIILLLDKSFMKTTAYALRQIMPLRLASQSSW